MLIPILMAPTNRFGSVRCRSRFPNRSDRNMAASETPEERARRIEDASLAARALVSRRRDERFVRWVLEPGSVRWTLIRSYSSVSGFIVAHAGGWVSRDTVCSRWSHCAACSFRTAGVDGRSYCTGHNRGAGCGCPRGRWWAPGQLRWWLRLGSFSCPIGRFQTAPFDAIRRVFHSLSRLVRHSVGARPRRG